MQDRRLEISHVGGLFDGACNETDLCPPHFQNFGEIAKNYFGGQADWKVGFYKTPRKSFKNWATFTPHVFWSKPPFSR